MTEQVWLNFVSTLCNSDRSAQNLTVYIFMMTHTLPLCVQGRDIQFKTTIRLRRSEHAWVIEYEVKRVFCVFMDLDGAIF